MPYSRVVAGSMVLFIWMILFSCPTLNLFEIFIYANCSLVEQDR